MQTGLSSDSLIPIGRGSGEFTLDRQTGKNTVAIDAYIKKSMSHRMRRKNHCAYVVDRNVQKGNSKNLWKK